MVGADRPGTDEGQSANQQQRPDEQLTVLQFIRGPGDDDHGDGGRQVRDRREPAHFHHPHIFTAAADNRRQPQYKTVHADTPGKVLRAEQDHVAGAEGFAIVTHRFDALLFTIQLFLQRRFFTLRQPGHLRRLIFHQHPPAEGPDHRRHPFDDEHFPPAEGLNQVAGDHRHPQDRHRVTEDQEGVGARAL